MIHLDIGEIGVALFQLRQAREKLGDAAMIGLGQEKAAKLLDRGGLASTPRRTAFAYFLFEPIAECRRAEAFADVVHERDDSGGELGAVGVARGDRINQLLKRRTRMAFP